MELHIYGRNLDIDDKTREHVESKLDQIDRHRPGLSNATVELAYEATRSQNDRIVAQVTLHVGRNPAAGPATGSNHDLSDKLSSAVFGPADQTIQEPYLPQRKKPPSRPRRC